MTRSINRLLAEGSRVLREHGVDSPEFDSRQLLMKAVGADNSAQLIMLDSVDSEQEKQFFEFIGRRAERYPLQYILGFWEFYGRKFLVDESVLIPRSDTEVLAETAVEFGKREKSGSALDLCSGSGILAVTLKCELGDIVSHGVELSEKAFLLSKRNAELLGAEVEFFNEDVAEFTPAQKYDIIVSNPPYVTFEEYKELEPEIFFEPETAFTAPDNGLFFYRLIAERYRAYLNRGGMLAFEIGASQAKDVCEIMKNCGYKNIEVIRDLNGLERAVTGISG